MMTRKMSSRTDAVILSPSLRSEIRNYESSVKNFIAWHDMMKWMNVLGPKNLVEMELLCSEKE
jgi:hypothetical protein